MLLSIGKMKIQKHIFLLYQHQELQVKVYQIYYQLLLNIHQYL